MISTEVYSQQEEVLFSDKAAGYEWVGFHITERNADKDAVSMFRKILLVC